jgi:hypothetical protein
VADRKQAEQLAYVMQFLYSLGFDLDTVKRAADAWWQIKGAPLSGVMVGDETLCANCGRERKHHLNDRCTSPGGTGWFYLSRFQKPTAGVGVDAVQTFSRQPPMDESKK